MEKAKYLLWLMLLLCSFSVEAASVIKSIRYEGNAVTQVSVMNREIYIKEGDQFNEALVEKSRQAIMDLELFKTVHYYLEENYTGNEPETQAAQIEVVFVVEEKYYMLILPRARIDDDEANLGIQLRWDNVWGLNHEVRALVEDRGNTRGIDEKRNSFTYYYPNVSNSAFNINLELQSINEVDETTGIIDRQDDIYHIGISRWLNKKGRHRGWFIGSSVQYQQRYNEVISGSQLSEDVEAIILGVSSGYSNLSNYEYNRGGKAYGYILDWSHDSIGSEEEFTKHQLYYRSYYRFDDRPLSNLNVQTKLGHSNSNFLGDTAFSLGSSDDLRGYENDRFNGNTMFLTNIEYMFPHAAYPVIRYVYFIDVGNTYDSLDEILHSPLNVGAGVGLRWKIRAFVKLDLRADAGYGFTDEDYRFTFGTRHAF